MFTCSCRLFGKQNVLIMKFDLLLFKNNLLDFITNPVLLCAALSWLAAQVIKLFTTPYYTKKFSMKQLIFGSGGMPSSHAAVVCSTCISCGILYGYNSAVFAISAILAFVVMRDAAGVRREAGKQAEVINQISEELGKRRKKFADITLPELLGHTPLQVVFGGLLGFFMAYFCQRFLFLRFL